MTCGGALLPSEEHFCSLRSARSCATPPTWASRGIEIDTVGLILMIVGIVGFVIALWLRAGGGQGAVALVPVLGRPRRAAAGPERTDASLLRI